MKFKNKHTGVILEPKSDMVVEQLQKNPDFEPYDGQNAAQGTQCCLNQTHNRSSLFSCPVSRGL